ncbi:MAG: sensor histidine kinase [Burkholderiales bacterium]
MIAVLRQRWVPWLFAWAGLVLTGALLIVRIDIAQRRELFQSSAEVAHRQLSQRAVQHEAILATLVLMSDRPAGGTRPGGPHPEQRLPGFYPQVLSVLRRDRGEHWPEPALEAAEAVSRAERRPALGPVDAGRGQYFLVLAGEPLSFALRIDVAQMVPWAEWPLPRAGPVRATLRHGADRIELQPGQPAAAQPAGLTEGFVFAKPLATTGQPFELRISLAVGPAQWPWGWLFAWTLLSAAALTALAAWLHGRRERRRAEELLRVGRVARLNTLGELAGGIAHELNQPLAAVLANTRAAQRMLAEEQPDAATAGEAMTQAATQARRAADVLARLRRLCEAPDKTQPRQAVRLESTARGVLDLLEPELRRRGIAVALEGQAPPVMADPVALEQIVHNLVGNAVQALEETAAGERRLRVDVTSGEGRGRISVRDNGPGMPADVLQHVFEPFFTTRRGGLGLGLSLCETLAQTMDGTLTAHNIAPHGAEFRLSLPLAKVAS